MRIGSSATPSTRIPWRTVTVVLVFAAILGGMIAAAQEPPIEEARGDDGGRGGKKRAPLTIPAGVKCASCHEDVLDHKKVHEPARKGCAECHRQEGRLHKFKDPTPPEQACLRCHEMKLEAVVHGPVASKLCTTCHDPHGSDHPGLLKASEKKVCARCHSSADKPSKKHVHGPYAVGVCQICHSPHSSANDSLLRRPGGELCLSCHAQLAPEGARPGDWHSPAEDQCVLCHSGHATDEPFLLKAPQPDLCFKCHKDIRETTENAPVKHKAITDGASCTGCHEAHASKFSALLRSEGGDLCLTCHDREYEQEKGRPLPNMKEQLGRAKYLHGPVQEKSCEGCHRPHGSDHFRLLRKPYPARFYAPFDLENFGLCFSCHPKELVLEEERTLTNFRDGRRNLHFLHVNRKKGRTCRACHETHASDLPHHLRETTPFGTWDLPIGYEKRPDGGFCSPGCHREVGYTRGDE